jgi:hypothetical protein
VRASIAILLLSVTLFTCKDEKDCCLPPVDQAWLNKTIADLEQSDESLTKFFYIVQGTYEGECVVFVNNCCPNCLTALTIYRCDGTELSNADPGKIKDPVVIWKPDNFACQLM